MTNSIRGTKHPPSKRTIRFWDRFPDLLSDDREDEFNELLTELRLVSEDYFRVEEKQNERKTS